MGLMMNASRIEMRSINKLEDYLTRNDRLAPDIRKNDKTPSWDGDILVYNSGMNTKADLVGKVPVQVKGTVRKDLTKKTIKFPIKKIDMKNYLNSNGVVYFVVYMKDYETCKIYYNALLPFDLTRLLEQTGKQKEKAVEFQEFPMNDSKEIINIFLNFIRNQKLQGGTVNQNFLSLDVLQNQRGQIDTLNIGYTGIGFENFSNIVEYSLKYPTYIYAQPKGFDVKIPVEKLTAEEIILTKPSPITVNGIVFYDSYEIIHKIGGWKAKFGKSILIDFENRKLTYSYKGSCLERLKDAKFLNALLKGQDIRINDELFSVDLNEDKVQLEKKVEEAIYSLENISGTMSVLGIAESIELDKLTDKEADHLNLLIKSVFFKKTVPLCVNGTPGVGTLTIGNLTFMLACQQAEAEEDGFILLDYFGDHNYCCKYESDNGELIMSPYISLKKDDFLKVSNIKYRAIIDSLDRFSQNDYQDELAVRLVLEMLAAYDELLEKNDEMLAVALEIIEKLEKHMTMDRNVLILNRLQIVKRIRDLTFDEMNVLLAIKKDTGDSFILTGVNILLESYKEAQMCLDMLSEEKRMEFETFPIMELWRR